MRYISTAGRATVLVSAARYSEPDDQADVAAEPSKRNSMMKTRRADTWTMPIRSWIAPSTSKVIGVRTRISGEEQLWRREGGS